MKATRLIHVDAVTATARRFLHLYTNDANPDTHICTCYISSSTLPSPVSSRHITSTLRIIAKKIGLKKLGFYLHEIGSHLLWSGGATMTLHLSRIPEHTIKIIGQWHSDAFLIYLQEHMVSFTKGVAVAISSVQ